MPDDSLERLLNNNNTPSSASIIRINDLLLEPKRKLEANIAEIARLEGQIQDLYLEQAKLQQSIEQYDIILAPMRKVPADVLLEIFYHCLPTDRYPTMHPSDAPLLLTWVCKDWRSTALSSTRLWSKMHISLPISTLTPIFPYHFDVNRDNEMEMTAVHQALTATACEARLKLVNMWLDRSGQHPLFMTILSHDRTTMPDENPHHPARAILRALIGNAYRWKEVEILISGTVYAELSAEICKSVDVLPCLTTFRLRCTGMPIRGLVPGQAPPYDTEVVSRVLKRTRNLKSLVLSLPARLRSQMISEDVLGNLTHLDIRSGVEETKLGDLLAQVCQNIIECKLKITKSPSVPQSRIKTTTIPFPLLRKLDIYDDGSVLTTSIFKAMDAPSLRSLEYAKCHERSVYAGWPGLPPPAPATNAITHPPSPSIFALLGAAPLLDELSLSYSGLDRDSVHTCLKVAREVRHLVLGSKKRQGVPGRTSEGVDLGVLSVQSESQMLTGESGEHLLPNLERLEAHEIFSFTDDDVLKMIKSRLEASRDGRISPLKSVVMTFVRQQQRDIQEEVLRSSRELVGIDLELVLDYEDPVRPYYSNILSARYGLTSEGGRGPIFELF